MGEPCGVGVMLDLLRFLLSTQRRACAALLACDGFRRMLPVPNLMRNSKVGRLYTTRPTNRLYKKIRVIGLW